MGDMVQAQPKIREPRVTVIIPTYNRASYLAMTIESVLQQDFTDFTLLVSDNASTDDTESVVKIFNDDRLTYVCRDENLGWLGNFNASLEGVSTDYVTHLGDDDVMLPGALTRSVAFLDEHPRVGMVHSSFDVIDAAGNVTAERAEWTKGLRVDTIETGREFIERSMIGSCRVCCPSALIRVDALPEVRYDPVDIPAADFTLWLRIALDWEIAFLADPFIKHRVHGGSDSSNWGDTAANGYYQGFEIILKVRAAKLRFLETYEQQLGDIRPLRAAAWKATRREFVDRARAGTLPDRDIGRTLRLLAQAARYDPRVFAEPYAWRLIGASVMGPRLVARVKARSSTQGKPL